MTFNHNEIEQKWQKKWEEEKCFHVKIDLNKKKFYVLDMFPYPSGAGLHVGHLASYTPTDIISRYKKAQGFNVLHPIGYDAFGLPAEQYAIQTGIHPAETTKKAIQNFKKQLKSFGYSFDWSREISTCDPSYYKWTQKLFLILLKKKLAYRKKTPVNWCPALRTTLANEEVIDGKSERGGHPVTQKKINQWILKITAYAEKLLKGLEEIHWPHRTKEGQKNWIGKSHGLEIYFNIKNTNKKASVFTTRPDTLFGCTFIGLSPEHPLIESEFSKNKEYPQILKYKKQSQSMSAVEKQKNPAGTGVFSGSYAIHPITKEELPIWIADYILMDYGTGAVMAVPAHDERDFIFAKKFKLPIKAVVQPLLNDDSSPPPSQKSSLNSLKNPSQQKQSKKAYNEKSRLPYTGNGVNFNSQFLDGLNTPSAIKKITQYISSKNQGVQKVQYKLRDWIFSRQRYWGEPFPVVHFEDNTQPVPDSELPVLLPETARYEPSEKGEPPLARIKSFVEYTSTEGKKGTRETDTMPGSAASSWYFLRYTDPHNDKAPFDFSAQKYWMPVDLYVGGPEHTVGHLLYSRFWQKVLYDAGLVSHKEPFKKLVHQGSILGSDGQRMSKSRGNTVAPDALRNTYGADTVRLYIVFLGPLDKDKPWSDTGITGCRRFLDRFWKICINENQQSQTEKQPPSDELNKILHKTIQKVTEDLEALSFNTAVSSMMILLNKLYEQNSKNHEILKTLCRLLQPFAPHISEEIWSRIGEKGLVSLQPWPSFDPLLTQTEKINLAVQINGKKQGIIEVSPSADEKTAMEQARRIEKITQILKKSKIKKVIYKPSRILNIVCK